MNQELQATPRSTFINVLAWLFILGAGFSTLISLLQNVMLHRMFPAGRVTEAVNSSTDQIPSDIAFLFNHIELLFFIFLLLSITSFISAIALLKRKNWARIAFIIFMALGILWNVIGVSLQFSMSNMIPAGAPTEMESVMTHMKIASLVMALAFSALFAWIIKKLLSTPIKAEFISPALYDNAESKP